MYYPCVQPPRGAEHLKIEEPQTAKGNHDVMPMIDAPTTVDLDRPVPGSTAIETTDESTWIGRIGQLKRVSLRDEVIALIVGMIRAGELRPGSRLPSEPRLLAMTGVSRSPLREALRELEAMGLIEILPGKGTFVREIAPETSDAQLILGLTDHELLKSIVEVRLTLEPLVAQLAAERATDQDLARLRAILDEMAAAGEDAERARNAHLAFHDALTDATHNVILAKVWSLFSVFYRDSPLLRGPETSVVPTAHEDLYAAIAAHNVDRAVALANGHNMDMLRILIA
jgi:GntR family transcriptional repressor for pyruvate dehydrogenase complex